MADSIAIITARGGSKRIPRKNIKEFCGKPIIAYSIEAAIESNIFDEVMVSTDDEEIKNIALQYGAKVPFMRSEKTSGDNVMTYEVLLEVLDEYKKRNIEFEYMSCIYPTAPFITADNLQRAMHILESESIDSVIPIVQFSFPPQRGFIMQDEKISFKWPENALVRSQDLEPMYHDAGQFYCLNVENFLNHHKLITDNTKSIILDDLEVQDIDNESDWRMAEFKYRYLHERNNEYV
ncbi:MAG: pseudaminic acid cytidylyltransferase [Lachnospiraceae bacterium]|nr:pseudaminic acid cytidylyltransferase [Lachnospiraceae bacterium]